MDVTFDVEVRSRLFFGYVGLEKSAGIVNVTEHSYTTKEMILEWIDVVTVENEWQRIPTLEAAPQKPFMVLVALDSVLRKERWFPVDDVAGLDSESFGWRNGAYELVGGHPAREGADVAVLESALGAQGDLDRLFAVGNGTGLAFKSYMNDPEPNFGLG